ncbi:MAG: DMT family protein [Waterburya sp.]
MLKPIVLLIISNIFMSFAWYGHLNSLPVSKSLSLPVIHNK